MLLLTQSGPLKSPAIPGQPHGAEFLIFARYRQTPLSVWRRLGEPQHRFLAPKAASVARVVIRKRVTRAKVLEYFGELPPCLVGIEACPSAHHWGRGLQGLGHTVRLSSVVCGRLALAVWKEPMKKAR